MSDDAVSLSKAWGPLAAADEAVCRTACEELSRFYPEHLWYVEVNHEAGTVSIDLPYQKPPHLRQYGFMLHLSTVLGADGGKRLMRAGGELLERFGLPRSMAQPEANAMAQEHGLIADGARDKSRH
jgi:hypothetical protein